MDESLFEVLRCPISGTRLRVAEAMRINELNDRIQNGKVRSHGGDVISGPLEAGLVNETNEWIYSVRCGIPSLLIDEAIHMESLEDSSA